MHPKRRSRCRILFASDDSDGKEVVRLRRMIRCNFRQQFERFQLNVRTSASGQREIDLRGHPYYLLSMALRSIITLPDPRLRIISAPVSAVDDTICALMDDMLETMYAAPGVGLAAIQIAVPKRVIVLDIAKREDETAAPQPLCLVNPEIIFASDDVSTYQEGCLSIPDIFEDVERPARVRARFLDRAGREQEIEAEGILAICLQHEFDHLNGVLFIDHISRLRRELVMKKFRKNAKHKAQNNKGGAAKERATASRGA